MACCSRQDIAFLMFFHSHVHKLQRPFVLFCFIKLILENLSLFPSFFVPHIIMVPGVPQRRVLLCLIQLTSTLWNRYGSRV